MSGSPGTALYSAAKSFVLKLSEGLAAEVEPYGVYCTASLPGGTDTELFVASGVSEWVASNLLVQIRDDAA